MVLRPKMYRSGNLTLASAILGAKVRCVKPPDMSYYNEHFSLQAFSLPVIFGVYHVRANIQGGGILLKEIKNPQVRYSEMKSGEPCFPYILFDVVL